MIIIIIHKPLLLLLSEALSAWVVAPVLYQHFALIVGKISLQSAFCKVLFAMFIVLKCAVCFVQCVHLQCVLFIVQGAVSGPWHTMCSMCGVHCSLYNVQSVAYCVQCVMCVAYRVHTSYMRYPRVQRPVCSSGCKEGVCGDGDGKFNLQVHSPHL